MAERGLSLLAIDTSVKQTEDKCAGINELPVEYAAEFQEVVDEPMLKRAIGNIDEGGLCQGKVYLSKNNMALPIYRLWNSANPNSRLDKWWAFKLPVGKIAQYRNDYEICYQFSPLDKLTYCNLKTNTKVVIGTGQSLKCDTYLTYPSSAVKQIYIEIDTKSPSVTDCKDFDGVFSWKPTTEITQ